MSEANVTTTTTTAPTATPNPTSSPAAPNSSPPEDTAVAAAAATALLDPDVESEDDYGDLSFLSSTHEEAPQKAPNGEDAKASGAIDQTPAAVVQTPAQPTPGAQPPAAPVQTPTPPAAAQEQSATPPAATPVSTAQPEQNGVQTPTSQPNPLESYTNWRNTSMEALATRDFALSEQDLQELEENPGKTMSKFAAKVFMTTVENCVAAVHSMLPQAISQTMEQKTTLQKNEEDFYAAHPMLKDRKDEVARIGVQWRALNPSASKEDFIKFVGPLAGQMLGVIMTAATPTVPEKKPSSLPPHVPAGGGAPRSGLTTSQPKNEFEAMLDSEDDEE